MSATQVEQENVALVRRGFEAFATGDMATLTDLFHPDAVWQLVPMGVLKGTYRSRDDIFAFFGQLKQESAGTFQAEPVAFAAVGDKVFVQEKVTGKRKGISVELSEVLVFTIADGKTREVNHYVGDYPAAIKFWS